VRLVRDAIALDGAGMAMLVLELVPEEVADRVTQSIMAPTLESVPDARPMGRCLSLRRARLRPANFQHNRRYQDLGRLISEAVRAYAGTSAPEIFLLRKMCFPWTRTNSRFF